MTCLRLKARSWRVRSAARSAACCTASESATLRSRLVRRRRLVWPWMTVSRLLKSCATPAARCPPLHFPRLLILRLEQRLVSDVLQDGQHVGSGGQGKWLEPQQTFPALASLGQELAFVPAQSFSAHKADAAARRNSSGASTPALQRVCPTIASLVRSVAVSSAALAWTCAGRKPGEWPGEAGVEGTCGRSSKAGALPAPARARRSRRRVRDSMFQLIGRSGTIRSSSSNFVAAFFVMLHFWSSRELEDFDVVEGLLQNDQPVGVAQLRDDLLPGVVRISRANDHLEGGIFRQR